MTRPSATTRWPARATPAAEENPVPPGTRTLASGPCTGPYPGVVPLLDAPPTRLDEQAWSAREAAHRRRIDAWVGPHQQRRRDGVAHPVWDFLFTYYSEPPNRLRRWHPGVGPVLAGEAARARLNWPFYTEAAGGVTVDAEAFLAK